MEHKPRRKRGWINFEVLEVHQENSETVTLSLIDQEERNVPFDYIAGQYITLRFDSLSEKPVVRSYTMSSAPSVDPSVLLTVKKIDGGLVSTHLCEGVRKGDVLKARGPIGKFCLEKETSCKDVVFIAAGSGVTPFVSMMKEYAQKDEVSLSLLVSFKTPEDRICGVELDHFQGLSNLRVQETFTRKVETAEQWKGRIDEEKLNSFCESVYLEKTFFICGPDIMMDNVSKFLLQQGVGPENVRTESFA